MVSSAPRLRSSPRFIPLVATLASIFVALVTGGPVGRGLYLIAAASLVTIAVRTLADLESPSNWAVASALLGLVGTSVFAATELSDINADGGGGPALIPVAWLFAATSWAAHVSQFKTLRWVITLVQTSFTTLSALVFLLVAARDTNSTLQTTGYVMAGLAASVGTVFAVIGVIGRIRVELAKRTA